MMSPGLSAVPQGMFSVAGSTAIRSIGTSSSAIAAIASSTAAPPDMSIFISCIPAEGLIEMPPVSKVTDLPTRPSFSPSPRPAYSRAIRRGSMSSPPLATASRPPMPRLDDPGTVEHLDLD